MRGRSRPATRSPITPSITATCWDSTLPEVRNEVLSASSSIDNTTGRPPIRLFRFPYGSDNAATLGVVNNIDYTAVGWTVDTLGWEGTVMGQSVASVTSRALAHLEPGEIILMHVGSVAADNSTLDADALPDIIRAIGRAVSLRDPEPVLVNHRSWPGVARRCRPARFTR